MDNPLYITDNTREIKDSQLTKPDRTILLENNHMLAI